MLTLSIRRPTKGDTERVRSLLKDAGLSPKDVGVRKMNKFIYVGRQTVRRTEHEALLIIGTLEKAGYILDSPTTIRELIQKDAFDSCMFMVPA